MLVIRDIPQNSTEWMQLRLGSIGGSSVATATATGSKDKLTRKKLMYDLASEVLTGFPSERYKFKYADRGHIYEGEARDLFSLMYDVEVEQIAMIKSEKPHRHYSADGIVSGKKDDIEIKVRIPSVFLRIAENDYPQSTYERKQVQYGLLISELEACYKIDYCPEMAEKGFNGLIVNRVERDEKEIRELDEGVGLFIEEMLKIVERMKKR